MRYLPLIFKNSVRNRRRSVLTIASLAVSLCLLGVVGALYTVLYIRDAAPALARRLVSIVSALGSEENFAGLCRAVLPLTSHLELRVPNAPAHQDALATARAALRNVAAFPTVVDAVGAARAEAVTVLLLAMADRLTPAQRATIGAIDEGAQIAAELNSLRAQLAALWDQAC